MSMRFNGNSDFCHKRRKIGTAQFWQEAAQV